MRVLIVDNDRDTADALGMLLKAAHCDVRVTYDAFTCLDEALRFTPELLLADISLPIMNGIELVRRIRQSRSLDQTVLAAITGYSDDYHRELAAAAGFDEYLVKPLPFDTLCGLLDKVKLRIDEFSKLVDRTLREQGQQ